MDKVPEESKKAFMKNLKIVKNNAKGIPSDVYQHIDQVMEPDSDPCASSSHNINNITVKGNYYHAERDVVINEIAERDVKKQRINHEDRKETKEVDFKQKWIEFLADAEQNKNFHRYRKMKMQLKPYEASGALDVKSYIRSLVAASDIDEFEKNIKDKALVEGQEKTCRCIKNISVLSMMKKNEYAPYFVPGEDGLESMTVQLKKMGQKTDKRKIYKADGIIRLEAYKDLEVLILETAGAFGHEDHAKTAFDNSKGMFALLAMLKTIADRYKHASVEEFSKLKLYFVQPSGYHIRLWSMQYAKNGLYDFVREKKILLSEDFNNREEQLVSLVNFFLSLKSLLEEIENTIAALKRQHEEKERHYDSENNSEDMLLTKMEMRRWTAEEDVNPHNIEQLHSIFCAATRKTAAIVRTEQDWAEKL
ncbi:hypothetical protein G6F46_009645 [Rhizopus delemar]|uniref:Uncharacterized protein n=2 Tax=Rhizopus TaxID=4842 RepID=A0A9P6YWM0_9FUNG|nr:hypothetical protein G6F55_002577 [Rhizopus delemar]KAG1538533.1 hypothetical protein G6F51_009712 [Rhizopus arrhizus]KAG1491199.1 hypothetical protein G6F54_010191 [Rhizopus delemar]KAG1504575.1 hypothetical protein G6F53_010367 [Rhizopus delemar]KAG1520427.1 hypothetical protein G6F52_007674 [Rhizopus delemar]